MRTAMKAIKLKRLTSGELLKRTARDWLQRSEMLALGVGRVGGGVAKRWGRGEGLSDGGGRVGSAG